MAIPKTAQCTTCGWEYPILDNEDLSTWGQHGDAREPAGSTVQCPDPIVQWKPAG